MTDQPTTTAQCGACGGLNGQHWHRCPDRDETAAPGPHTDQPDTSSLHARLCRMLGAAQDAADDDLIETVRGMCVRTQDAFLLGTHDIEVCNRDREPARRQLEHIAAAPSNADMWARLGMALGWDPLRAGLAARDRRSLAERYADARATEFEKALTAAKAENDGWAETTRNTDRLTSQQITAERAAHEEHRRQLADALGWDDPAQWPRLIRAAEQIFAGRRTWREKAEEIEADRNRLADEVTALREGIGHLRDEAEQCRTAVCEALGRHMGLGWPTIVERVELAVAGASERADLLEEARDALAAAGQNGAHGDDWPAIAPAIRALAAELKLRRGNDEVNRREASNRREALASALGLGRNAHWDAITARAGEVQAHLADYENRITWETNCGEHAWLLDALQTAETGRDEAGQLAENMQGRATTLAAQVGQLVDRLGEYADRGIANGERAEAAE